MTVTAARRLLERTGEHPVVSVYFGLDPARFATAPARASEARSIVDQLRRSVDSSLSHEDRRVLEEDLARVEDYLGSDDMPVSGNPAVAVFSSGQDGLFEAVGLTHTVPPKAIVATVPYVEPLATQAELGRWCAVLVSRRAGHVYLGVGSRVRRHQSIEDYVRGRGDRGAATINTEEQDAEGHLLRLAGVIYDDWQRSHFTLLALSGPPESVSGLRKVLHPDLRRVLAEAPLDLDDSEAGDSEVRSAMRRLLDDKEARGRSEALRELSDPRRTVAGVADTLQALNERRVQTLLLARDFAGSGGRCPADGMLLPRDVARCPADGTAVAPVADLRAAAVRTAVCQDATVIAFPEPEEALPPGREIAALLRF